MTPCTPDVRLRIRRLSLDAADAADDRIEAVDFAAALQRELTARLSASDDHRTRAGDDSLTRRVATAVGPHLAPFTSRQHG
jgi:hypothetical protein